MDAEFLTMNIAYKAADRTFKIEGDVKKEKRADMINEFLRMQMGNGADKSEPIKRKEYNINLRWYPENDTFKVESNTGNKSLREGILLDILRQLAYE
jgi:hypothetical protein